MLLPRLLERLVRRGTLNYVAPDGRQWRFGNGAPPEITLAITSPRILRRLPRQFSLAFAEGYMNGEIQLRQGTPQEMLQLFFLNLHGKARGLIGNGAFRDLRNRMTLSHRAILPAHAKRNVAHHYDLADEFYRLFLDPDLQYSCGYWAEGVLSLEEAQAAKRAHIAAKLCLRPNMRVLDIGCGWGGLALELAAKHGARVEGITLSERQLKVARARAQKAGLAEQCQFHLRDYRTQQGVYDRIVSVGMFEHVGHRNYKDFFRALAALLHGDGIALLHSIATLDRRPAPINPFIEKYIFPAAQLPTLAETVHEPAKAELFVTDSEVWRLHYAKTLEAWHQNLRANRERVVRLFDEKFYRMWELYLLSCAGGFRHGSMVVSQVQMTHRNLQSQVPLTRKYLYR